MNSTKILRINSLSIKLNNLNKNYPQKNLKSKIFRNNQKISNSFNLTKKRTNKSLDKNTLNRSIKPN